MTTHKDDLILVTGGTGFVGSYLLRHLIRKGFTNIRALKRTTSSMSLVREVEDQIDWIVGDILDVFSLAEAMKNVQKIYHCAALITFHPKEVNMMIQVNQEGTANVVNEALQAGVKKLIHVSSIAALGRIKKDKEISEESKWERNKLNSNYAISKYLAEQEVWRGMAEGLQVAIVNPSIILGSGNWDDGPLKLFKLTWKEFPFYPIGISGFVDVRDVARFMELLMESNIEGERFILNAENLSYKELQTRIAKALGKKPPTISFSPILQRIAWNIEWFLYLFFGKTPLITKETARQTSWKIHYLNQKSIDTFSFNYTSMADTLQETCQQFKEASQQSFTPKYLPFS